jgi:hypothetical protein
MYFVDVDVICKLAHWNILPHLPDLLGCQWNQIATVSSLRYRAQRAIETPDGKLFITSAAALKVVECIRLMRAMPAPDAAVLEDLTEIAQVDPGEAVLIAVMLGDPVGKFITGDKRALRALSQHSLATSLAGKIVLVEQILELCVDQKGREWLLANIREHKGIDKAISMIVGSDCDASLENLSAGLDSYIREIGNLCHPSMIANNITFDVAPTN